MGFYYRKIDDPSVQAHLAESYQRWDGEPGRGNYRIACWACSKDFYATVPTARWCSQACVREGAKRRCLAHAKALREQKHSCIRCGKAFQGRRSDAKYCSNACRQAAYRVTGKGLSRLRQPFMRNVQDGGDV